MGANQVHTRTGGQKHRPPVRLAVVVMALGALAGTRGAGQLGTAATPVRSMYLVTPGADYASLLPKPPLPGSVQQQADMDAVWQAERTRTPQQIHQAQTDDANESIFAFANAVGPGLTSAALPITAALSTHVRHESAVVNPSLKLAFARPRPFVADTALHPVCPKTESNSYPSGHAMVGYLEAYTLAAMLPEHKDAILARARQFAANRVVCGVHYPSDVEASRTVSLALFGSLLTSASFQHELQAARLELRARLHLPPDPTTSATEVTPPTHTAGKLSQGKVQYATNPTPLPLE